MKPTLETINNKLDLLITLLSDVKNKGIPTTKEIVVPRVIMKVKGKKK